MDDEEGRGAWPPVEIVAVSRELTAIARAASVSRMAVSAGGLRFEFEAAAPAAPAAPDVPVGVPAIAAAEPRHGVRAPLIGVYYRAPAPGAEPFVAVGDRVKPGQPVAIVEAMKLMNEVVADREGVVREIHCADGEVVEYGQVLVSLDVDREAP